MCIQCDALCTKCTSSPTNCQECITGYYLYLSTTCIDTCPLPTFAHLSSTNIGTCLDCNIYCVGLTIQMYHPTSLN